MQGVSDQEEAKDADEDDKIDQEGREGLAESSGDGMAIEAMRNDEGWDDVRSGWSDTEKEWCVRMEVGSMAEKKLSDEVSSGSASGHRVVSVNWVDTNRGTRAKPRQTLRARGKGLPRRRQGHGS